MSTADALGAGSPTSGAAAVSPHDATPDVAAPRPVGIIAMLAAIVSFALSTPIVKWAGETGVVIAFWRMWMSLGLWWIAIAVLRRPTASRRRSSGQRQSWPDRRAWKLVAPAGIFFGLNISILFTAITKTSIAHAEFIATLTPLLVIPLGALLFGEGPNWSALRWGAISIVGVTLVLFFGPSQGSASLGGDLLMVLVLGSWTSYLLFTKRARAAGVDTVTFMACMMPTGLITAGPMALILARDEIFDMGARGWIVAATLAVLTGMVAHGCVAFAQQHLPIATITVMQTSQPALAVGFAFVILSESVRWPQMIGMGLVIVGIALFTITSQRTVTMSTNRQPTPAPDRP